MSYAAMQQEVDTILIMLCVILGNFFGSIDNCLIKTYSTYTILSKIKL